MGNAMTKQVDKNPKWKLQKLGKPSFCLPFKYPRHGEVRSQHQHEPEQTEGPFESKELVNGSASSLQVSHTYPSKGGNLLVHHMSLDTDFSNGQTLLLDCRKIISGKANDSGNNALETLISLCINQPVGGSTPWRLFLSIEPADVCKMPCNQSVGKVKLSEYTVILQVPLAYLNTFTEEVAKEIFDKFRLHFNEGIQVVYLLGQRFCVTTINDEKPLDLVGTELPGEVIWKLRQQKITILVEEIFKSRENLVSRSDKEQGLSSSHQGAKQLTQAGSERRGYGKASTSSPNGVHKLKQDRKALRPGAQKQEVPKKRKQQKY